MTLPNILTFLRYGTCSLSLCGDCNILIQNPSFWFSTKHSKGQSYTGHRPQISSTKLFHSVHINSYPSASTQESQHEAGPSQSTAPATSMQLPCPWHHMGWGQAMTILLETDLKPECNTPRLRDTGFSPCLNKGFHFSHCLRHKTGKSPWKQASIIS